MIKAIIGLGNPGPKFTYTRHNIGFRILDRLAEKMRASWSLEKLFEKAEIHVANRNILLIKPQTFMNNSGDVIPYLQKKGIQTNEILVVHDELEKNFGSITIREGGSARGHNGLKSIISRCSPEFFRLRFGIGRPENREDVADYVLEKFSETTDEVDALINESVEAILNEVQ